MIITCPECLTKFRFPEDRIPEGGSKARCSRCQHVFQVQRPASPGESFFSEGESPSEFGELEKYEGSSRGRFFWWKWAVLGLLVAGIVAALIFYFAGGSRGERAPRGFSSWGQYLSEKASALKGITPSFSFLKRYFGIGEPAEGFISLDKVRGYYLENNNQDRLFVIEGEAVNHWKESRSFIKVKGVLLDSRGNKVQEQEAFCGNILSEKDLKEMSGGAIGKSLSSQFGVSFSNVNLFPNKSVPFMIVFLDLSLEGPQSKLAQGPGEKPAEVPHGLSDFTVEVVSSQKGSK